MNNQIANSLNRFSEEIKKEISTVSADEAPTDSYESWIKACLPRTIYKPMSLHHHQFWQWAWSIRGKMESGERIPPYVLCMSRGHGKSSMAEGLAVMLGCFNICKYIIILRNDIGAAEEAIANIKKITEGLEISKFYPKMSTVGKAKYRDQAYTSTYMTTAGGVVIRAMSLGQYGRGMHSSEFRPDGLFADDLDDARDTDALTFSKENVLASSYLASMSNNPVILFIQNLVKPGGIMERIINRKSDILSGAIIHGPIRAINDMTWKKGGDGRVRIAGGSPTWGAFGIQEAQKKIDDMGLYHFEREYQHEVYRGQGMVFSSEWFIIIDRLPIESILNKTITLVRYWDKGGTEGGGCPTSGVLMGMVRRGKAFDDASYYAIDEVSGQWGDIEREEIITMTAIKDRENYGKVITAIEQEPSAGGKQSADITVRRLAGFSVVKDPKRTGKIHRASPLAAQCKIGNVYVLGPLKDSGYIERMVAFPAKSDTADASSGAFHCLVNGLITTGNYLK